MTSGTVNDNSTSAQLSPSIRAMVAGATALVMMNHYPLPQMNSLRINLTSDFHNITTRLVTRYNWAAVAT